MNTTWFDVAGSKKEQVNQYVGSSQIRLLDLSTKKGQAEAAKYGIKSYIDLGYEGEDKKDENGKLLYVLEKRDSYYHGA